MEWLIILTIMVVVLVVPVMLAAKMLNARNSGFFSALLAVIAAAIANALTGSFFHNPWLAALLAIIVTAVCFSLILGARFLQSLGIAILAYIIQVGLVFLLATFGLAAGSTLGLSL
ncbi:hypothetical protein [Pleionea litopenaei]|uniref:Uncharacterized protein n=1 Tax=Pleionea litopenaei TaxID=3070815 RepID=A0AA51RWT9_9GAMM|nr:hypothetical protein [Pleionea sp. HL-JVS1]WMS88954.1 hypothetical protein Q9312_08570 [Pleionea sp. HL-JVS1]